MLFTSSISFAVCNHYYRTCLWFYFNQQVFLVDPPWISSDHSRAVIKIQIVWFLLLRVHFHISVPQSTLHSPSCYTLRKTLLSLSLPYFSSLWSHENLERNWRWPRVQGKRTLPRANSNRTWYLFRFYFFHYCVLFRSYGPLMGCVTFILFIVFSAVLCVSSYLPLL